MTDYISLVKQAQTGTSEERRVAFDRLVLAYQGMAVHYAQTLTIDRHIAEDAVQEAFLTAYLRIDQLREPEAFPFWLRRIIQTHCDRMLRRKQPRQEPLEFHDLTTEPNSPEALLEVREVQDRVHHAVISLPENERAVAEGFYFQGESQQEIADRLEIPLTTVKKRLQYARQHLRLLVGDLNAAFDQAIANVFQSGRRSQQPVYIYPQKETINETEGENW
jgi:RNA polymerase sigma factor (sigma-70 family)